MFGIGAKSEEPVEEPVAASTEESTEPVVTEPSEPQDGSVTLSAEQYNALIDRVEELEVSTPNPRPDYDVDELAAEGQTFPTEQTTENLDEMSNTQLVQFIASEVGRGNRQLQTEVQTLKILREIDKCEVKYNDFWDFEKEIYAVAQKNPTLSMEQAYKLVKGDTPEKKPGDPAPRTQTQKLFNLPSRTPTGEKPSLAPGASEVQKTMTAKEAAEQAWNEMRKGS